MLQGAVSLNARGGETCMKKREESYNPNVLCPFYKKDDGKRCITCEGIVENSSVVLTFRYDTLLKKQIAVFCSGYYKNCEVYRMLIQKYEDE